MRSELSSKYVHFSVDELKNIYDSLEAQIVEWQKQQREIMEVVKQKLGFTDINIDEIPAVPKQRNKKYRTESENNPKKPKTFEFGKK